ncbi:type IV pilus biogenesis protein PilP [Desulfovibrio legallii]|nr:type IV pilus biogenesis protein PilP [Desulfovibrio legallii]
MVMRVTKRAKIIWGVLLALSLAFAGLLAARRFSSSPTPPSVAVAAPVQKKSAPQAASGKKDAGRIPDAVPVSNTIAQAVAGRLGRITELQAQEQELRLEASIAKLRKEKEEALRAPAVPLSLPALTPPAASSPAPAAVERRSGGGLRVVSVQGVGGQLSATVRTGSGQVVVRPGSRLGDAVVTSISRHGVTVRRGGKISSLPFE